MRLTYVATLMLVFTAWTGVFAAEPICFEIELVQIDTLDVLQKTEACADKAFGTKAESVDERGQVTSKFTTDIRFAEMKNGEIRIEGKVDWQDANGKGENEAKFVTKNESPVWIKVDNNTKMLNITAYKPAPSPTADVVR